MMHTAKYMHQILDLALPAYDELFEEIDLSGLVENKGIMYIWNDQNLKSRELEINIRNEIGAEQQLLNKSEIHDLEPNIKNIYHAGVFYKSNDTPQPYLIGMTLEVRQLHMVTLVIFHLMHLSL